MIEGEEILLGQTLWNANGTADEMVRWMKWCTSCGMRYINDINGINYGKRIMEALEQRNQNFGCRPEDERLFVDYKATGRVVSTVRHKITSDRRGEAKLHKRHAFHKKDTLIMCHRL